MTNWLTRQQAAKLLSVSTSTLDRYRARGVVNGYKREGSNRLWFDIEEITELSVPRRA